SPCGDFTSGLALFRRDLPDRARERRVFRRIDRPVLHFRACRILAEEVIALPVLRRPDRPRDEAAAAVGADVAEHALDAGCAERALVAADPRRGGIGRQRLVAVLATRAKLQHHSAMVAPDPPISAGRSFIFGRPSLIGSLVSW